MAGWLFLIVMLTGALVVLNAARPSVGPSSLVPSWFLAFLTTDLAFHHIALQLLVAAGFIWAGALESLPGKLALAVLVVSSAWIVILWLPNLRAAGVTRAVADEFGFDEVNAIPRALQLVPLRRRRQGVSVAHDVEYSRAAGRVLTMDIYRGLSGEKRRPALIYLHGKPGCDLARPPRRRKSRHCLVAQARRRVERGPGFHRNRRRLRGWPHCGYGGADAR
jgi:hypothetical protein